MKDDLELKDLEQYTGATRYYSVLGNVVTDGIAYIMRNGYSWFVTDSLIRARPLLKHNPFVTLRLVLFTDNSAEVRYEDGNGKLLDKQKYDYTDAKRELTLFLIKQSQSNKPILLLANEY